MKRHLINACFLLGFTFLLFSCQSNASKEAEKARLDSLEKQTQHAMDSSEDELLKMVNSTDDSDIVNDPNAPVKGDTIKNK